MKYYHIIIIYIYIPKACEYGALNWNNFIYDKYYYNIPTVHSII